MTPEQTIISQNKMIIKLNKQLITLLSGKKEQPKTETKADRAKRKSLETAKKHINQA